MSKTVRYRKKPGTGRHSFRVDGKRHSLVPGDVVELPATYSFGSFANQYELISGHRRTKRIRAKVEQGRDSSKQKTLEIVKVGEKFNVVNPDNPDKPLNEKSITKKEATELINSENHNLDILDWDQLVAIMEEKGLEILDEYETEDQLREAIRESEDK